MRPKENRYHGIAGVSGPVPVFDGQLPADYEPCATPWCSDPAEHFAANWESAWIDLGGEG